MTRCLIALGSNLGDRAATLDAALVALATAPGVELLGQSSWQLTLPVGGHAGQKEFLNGAAIVETSLPATDVLSLLQQVETQFGRQRDQRWGDRTLDLDLLLYGSAVIDTPSLQVPHPRMSYRRFVLEPAVEIGGEMVHPTIGWTLEQLLDHLESGADVVAIVSQDDAARHALAATLLVKYEVELGAASADEEQLWPAAKTTWLAMPEWLAMPAAPPSNGHPKLTVLLGGGWHAAPGRGPTLQLDVVNGDEVEREVFAAIEAVWPRLGPSGGERLQ
jgi:2-amino-4-hydroxy-6-hydroxymethyldihydropteridine diphosphokinase